MYIYIYLPDDAAARTTCANDMVDSCRAFLNGVFFKRLDQGRSLAERERIVDQLFSDMKQIVKVDPTKYNIICREHSYCYPENWVRTVMLAQHS